MARRLRIAFALGAAWASAACGASIPRPPGGAAVREAGVVVPYPPPPARVEVIPPQRDPRHVWVDGQWEWDRGRFRWIEGKWVLPPPNAHFTSWTVRRTTDGALLFQSAAWRGPNGRRLAVSPGDRVCRPSPSGRSTP